MRKPQTTAPKSLTADAIPMETVRADIIQGPEIKVRCLLPAHRRFIILTFGSSPLVVPIDDPGTYEIDLEATTPVSRWPAAVIAVKEEHVLAFHNMPVVTSRNIQMRRKRDGISV